MHVSTLTICTLIVICTLGGAWWIRRRLVGLQRWLTIQLKLSSSTKAIGLTDVEPNSAKFDYGPILRSHQRVIILLNDGRTWLSLHRDDLRARFEDRNKDTTVFLIRPNSVMVEVLAKKGNVTTDVLAGRIKESIQLLQDIRQPTTNLEILGHDLFNPHSVVLGDDTAVLTPYFASRGGRNVPAFRFSDVGDDCYFRHLAADLEGLRKDAVVLADTPRHESLAQFPLPSRGRSERP
jgi:hypothetical protein